MEFSQKKRVKTEGDRINAQIQRQKSIFKNLSWQSKQKDRKIRYTKGLFSVLEKYYEQLKVVIQREKQEDTELIKRAKANPGKKYIGSVYRSSILKQLPRSDHKRRFVT